VSTKLRLYSVYVLSVFLYGAETWTMTKAMPAKVDAFDLRRILGIHYRQQVSNAEVMPLTVCPPLSMTIHSLLLRLFGHIACADPEIVHCHALHAAIILATNYCVCKCMCVRVAALSGIYYSGPSC